MGNFSFENILISFIVTWGIGLLPPTLIRYVFLKRPVGNWAAIGICGLFYFFSFLVYSAISGSSRGHGALILVAMVSYWILRKDSPIKRGVETEVLPSRQSAASQPPVIGSSTLAYPSESRSTPHPPDMSAQTTPPPATTYQASVLDEDAIYEIVANEMDSGKMDKGLWTRLYAEHDGDEKKIKIAYIKRRAEKLMAADRARIDELQRQHAEQIAQQERDKEIKEQERRRIEKLNVKARVLERLERGESGPLSSDEFLNAVKFDAEVQETAMRLGVSLNDASAVVRHKIELDGKQFRYGDYRYDRLSDAIAYAERVGSSPATISSAVQDSSVTKVSLQRQPELPASLRIRSPSQSEVADLAASANVTNEHAREMLLLGVSKAYDKFVYQTYRYDRVADALTYARADQRHFGQPPSLDQIERRLSALGYRLNKTGAFWYVKEPLGGSSNRMDIDELIAYLNEREIAFSQRAH